MGVMTEYFLADSIEAAAAMVASHSYRDHRWDQRLGAPDPMTDLEVLLSAVTGIAERDLDLSETSGVYAAVDEAIVLPVPPQLVTALAGLDPDRFDVVAQDLDDAGIDFGGDTADVLRDLAEFLAHGVASNRQVFVMVCP